MTRSIKQRIASVGLATVAVTAIGGTVSGAGDDATTCPTWHPRIIVSGRQHTWNPDNAVERRYQLTLNPGDAIDGRHRHTLNPGNVVDGRNQHTLNPDNVVDGRYQHTLNPAGDRSDACLSPFPTNP